MELVLERSDYGAYAVEQERGEERLENLEEYHRAAQDFEEMGGGGLTDFLERVSLVSDTDNMDDDSDAVTLITLHQAKGLEYRVVFIVGMEEGILPHIRSVDDDKQMEEERRLLLRWDYAGEGAALPAQGIPARLQGRHGAEHALPLPRRHPQGAGYAHGDRLLAAA